MNTIYLFQDDSNNGISVSAYEVTSDEYENNHIIVKEPRHNYLPATLNILRNVLSQAGIKVIME